MLELNKIIEYCNKLHEEEVNSTANNDSVKDKARIERRKNETYFTRLTRASLGISQNLDLSDDVYSLLAALPEAIFPKMYVIGWGKKRRKSIQKPDEKTNSADESTSELEAPKLLLDYAKNYGKEFVINKVDQVIKQLNEKKLEYALICHGLSPTSDTILLLADIGRSVRVSNAIRLRKQKVLLADVSWIKYNRSINQLFKKREFLDQLRVCLDKRKRLYRALGLEYKVFGISDFEQDEHILVKSEIINHTKEFRELAKLLYGKKALEPLKSKEIKQVIGKSLGQIPSKLEIHLPPTIRALIKLKNKKVGYALEEVLDTDLKILRTVSELFSSFDEDIFVYYFAQYFAQTYFKDYIKIAPISETKFDQPFLMHSEHFSKITSKEKEQKGESDQLAYVYCPQYKLGGLNLLPYCSISGDVLKKSIPVEELLNGTILLADSYENEVEKIIGVLTKTETVHRNRLISDIFSFVHHMYQTLPIKNKEILFNKIEPISAQIANQIASENDTPDKYCIIFSEWIKAIDKPNAAIPFHLIPYFWEDEDWDLDRIKNVSEFIITLLEIVNNICD